MRRPALDDHRNRCTDRKPLRGLLALFGVMSLAGIVAGGSWGRAAPSYTFQSALTGVLAETIDFGDFPIEQDVIVFYEHTLGSIPRISLENGEWINGGLPHLIDYDEHIGKCVRDITSQIPDQHWDGYAVIDYESWTPWWDDTTPRYREAMSAYVLRTVEGATVEDSLVIGEMLYNYYGRLIFEDTIRLAKALRPNAKWGFWSLPKRRHADLEDGQWLWDLCDAFYPSVYMRDYLVPDGTPLRLGEAHYSSYVNEILIGRVGLARELAGEDREVIAFAWPRYGNTNANQWLRLRDLEPHHLRIMLQGPYSWDADGIILWDNISQAGIAENFQAYFDGVIGPTIETVTELVLDLEQSGNDAFRREDVNRDGVVDIADLSLILSRFGTTDPDADVNQDGIVDSGDFVLVQRALEDH